jgi:hypothetical protein
MITGKSPPDGVQRLNPKLNPQKSFVMEKPLATEETNHSNKPGEEFY